MDKSLEEGSVDIEFERQKAMLPDVPGFGERVKHSISSLKMRVRDSVSSVLRVDERRDKKILKESNTFLKEEPIRKLSRHSMRLMQPYGELEGSCFKIDHDLETQYSYGAACFHQFEDDYLAREQGIANPLKVMTPDGVKEVEVVYRNEDLDLLFFRYKDETHDESDLVPLEDAPAGRKIYSVGYPEREEPGPTVVPGVLSDSNLEEAVWDTMGNTEYEGNKDWQLEYLKTYIHGEDMEIRKIMKSNIMPGNSGGLVGSINNEGESVIHGMAQGSLMVPTISSTKKRDAWYLPASVIKDEFEKFKKDGFEEVLPEAA